MIPLRDSVPTRKWPWVTYGLIVLNLFVFGWEFLSPNLEALIDRYALIAARVNFSQLTTLYPFLTSQFLHAGPAHLLVNLWFLKIFGDNVEEALGHWRFLFFYLFCGFLAGLSQYFLMMNSTVPMLGASGAIAGVLGAYCVLFPDHRIETLVPVFGFWRIIELPAFLMLVYWFIIQFFSGVGSLLMTEVGGVAFMAHAGGFLSGWLIARRFQQRTWQKSNFEIG